jgi:hypothetical protein
LSRIRAAQLLDVIIDIVEVVEMHLFFVIDDGFKKSQARAVTVFLHTNRNWL